MFALIQSGQIYTDSAGYPVKITRSTVHSVFFLRMDGRSGRVRITEFNNLFEHIDHQEYRKILADTEQEKHLKNYAQCNGGDTCIRLLSSGFATHSTIATT